MFHLLLLLENILFGNHFQFLAKEYHLTPNNEHDLIFSEN